MNVSLPDELKAFVDAQVSSGDYGSTSEYVRDLIRQAQDRDRLRADGSTHGIRDIVRADSPRHEKAEDAGHN